MVLFGEATTFSKHISRALTICFPWLLRSGCICCGFAPEGAEEVVTNFLEVMICHVDHFFSRIPVHHFALTDSHCLQANRVNLQFA